jgi:prepilin-type N-terminal cleavage/methylation domain-containing protein
MPVRRRAFTLVELLVVIGIIAVLVAILLPIVTRVRGQAINQVCKNNLREIGNAIVIYCNNHRGKFADPVTLGGAACRRLAGEGSPAEVYGWSALLDQLGYLPADRATGGVWVCPAQTERLQAYKNTYVAWTMPRAIFQNKRPWWARLVWENDVYEPYATGVPAPVPPVMDPRDGYVGFTNAAGFMPEDGYVGPHQYRLAVSAQYEPESVSAIPKGTLFYPAGYTHALLPDLSLATYQHYKIARGKNSKGQEFIAAVSPVRVE